MVVGVTSIGQVDSWVFAGGLSDGTVVLILGWIALWSLKVVLWGVSCVCSLLYSIGIDIFWTSINTTYNAIINLFLMIITITTIPLIPSHHIPKIFLPHYTILFKRSSLIPAHHLRVIDLVYYWYFLRTWVRWIGFFIKLILLLLLLLTEFSQLSNVFIHWGKTFTIVSSVVYYGVIYL